MIDTPKTDRASVGRYDCTRRTGLLRWEYLVKDSYAQFVPVEFARELERENYALRAELERLRDIVSPADVESIDAVLAISHLTK